MLFDIFHFFFFLLVEKLLLGMFKCGHYAVASSSDQKQINIFLA